MDKPYRYWMVHRLENGYSPNRIHDSLGEAEIEAQRLAKANPGVFFTVLEGFKGYRTAEPKIETLFLDDSPVEDN